MARITRRRGYRRARSGTSSIQLDIRSGGHAPGRSRGGGNRGGALEALEGRVLFSAYTVTTSGDTAGSVTPTGPSTFTATTLRAALTAANAHAGADVINFASTVTGAISLGTALPRVTDALSIAGPGASALTVQRGPTTTTDFSLLAVDAGKVAGVSGLTLFNGTGTCQADGSVRGGGVVNAGTLTLTRCTVSGNEATGRAGAEGVGGASGGAGGDGLGGGIYNAGRLTLASCVVTDNIADGGGGGDGGPVGGDGGNAAGGGVYNAGRLTVTGSFLADNAADGGGGGGIALTGGHGGDATGGGIDSAPGAALVLADSIVTGNAATGGAGGPDGSGGGGHSGSAAGGGVASGGDAALTDSSLTGNTATGGLTRPFIPNTAGDARGGGVDNAGTLTLTRCSLSGNAAVAGNATGGGINNGGRLTVDHCDLSANRATAGLGGDFASGGGIYTTSIATVRGSTLSDNAATGGDGRGDQTGGGTGSGGGVSNAGTLTLTASTLSGNAATGGASVNGPPRDSNPGGNGAGGGVFNSGTASLVDCTLSANAATGGVDGSNDVNDVFTDEFTGGEGIGGGIDNLPGDHLTVTDSTLSGNTATGGASDAVFAYIGNPYSGSTGLDGGPGRGGAVSNGGTASFANSTFSGNRAVGGAGSGGETGAGDGGDATGGAVFNGGPLTLANCTIAGNAAEGGPGALSDRDGGGTDGASIGGGVVTTATGVGGSARLDNTIVAANRAFPTAGFEIGIVADPDVHGPFTSGPGGAGGHNLIGDVGSATGFTATDRVGGGANPVLDPKLAPLADNGGPTLTQALLPGSPAIDAGSNALAVAPGGAALTTDQRGAGFPRFLGARVDVGAFEQPAAGTILTVTGTAGNDTITVTQTGASLIVTRNGVTTHRGAFEFAGLALIGLGGDDTLSVDKAITTPTTLNGGAGSDVLHPGGGPANVIGGADADAVDYSDNTTGVAVSTDDVANDGPGGRQNVHSDVEIVLGGGGNDTLYGSFSKANVLVGNGGDDVLHGLGSRDVLIGGAGRDRLLGEGDEDLLIDSATVYDNNVPLLRTLRSAWQDPATPYANRIARLQAGAQGVVIRSSTVPNDGAADLLTGGTERDWFVSHTGDSLADKAVDETSTVL